MFSQRAIIRSTQRLGARPLTRTAFRSRPYSEGPLGKPLEGATDNAFNRERAHVKEHAASSANLWRKMSIYIVIPSLLLASANAYVRYKAHWEHFEHDLKEHPMEERPQYSYLNVRTKNFWFGDGDKTLFWNDKVNYHKKDDE